MKLAIVNGSPRGRKSNSDRIIGWMSEGIDDSFKIYASDIKKQDEAADIVEAAESILFVFPLYTDAMPGIVKAFMEKMQKKDLSGKKITFVIHSGFSEAIHSRFAEKYCRYFARKNGMEILGTVVMGGSEALQMAPDEYFGKRNKAFVLLKENIKNQTHLDESAVKIINGKEHFSNAMLFILKFMPTDFYWNSRLKKNNAFKNRFDRPYE